MQRNVSVVEDLNGNKIVFIHDIRFKGRQAIEWEDVEMYLKQYVGEARIIKRMQNTGGIDMIPDLRCRFLMRRVK